MKFDIYSPKLKTHLQTMSREQQAAFVALAIGHVSPLYENDARLYRELGPLLRPALADLWAVAEGGQADLASQTRAKQAVEAAEEESAWILEAARAVWFGIRGVLDDNPKDLKQALLGCIDAAGLTDADDELVPQEEEQQWQMDTADRIVSASELSRAALGSWAQPKPRWLVRFES